MDFKKGITLKEFREKGEWNGFRFSDIESDDLREMEDNFIIVFYDSDYYGSHSEYDEGEEKCLYGIHPRHKEFLNSLVGEDFSHGHFSYSRAEEAFNEKEDENEADFILLN